MVKSRVAMVETHGTFEDVVSQADPKLREIATAARILLADIMPGITEVPWPRQKTVGYGVGPKKMSEHFCYLAIHAKHVNLGFFYGADLEDLDGLLQGTGKSFRHIKLSTTDDLRSSSLKRLIVQASTHLPKLASRN